MALPASETFTAANGTQVSALTGWAKPTGAVDPDVQTNSAAPDSAGNEQSAYWASDAFANDQYATATIVAIGGGAVQIGPAVRVASGALTYYGFYCDNTFSYLFRMNAGVWVQMGSDGAAFAVNDVIRLQISGTTITPMKNGATLSPPGAQTDASIASGSAGITGYNDGTVTRLDNWEGGNLAGAATSLFPARRMRGFEGLIIR